MPMNRIERAQTLRAQANELGDILIALSAVVDDDDPLGGLLGTIIRNQTMLAQTVVEMLLDEKS
jgi:hypothetical protein